MGENGATQLFEYSIMFFRCTNYETCNQELFKKVKDRVLKKPGVEKVLAGRVIVREGRR